MESKILEPVTHVLAFLILFLFLGGASLIGWGSIQSVSAQTPADVCEGVRLTGAECTHDPARSAQCNENPNDPACAGTAEQQVAIVIQNVLKTFSAVVGIAGVVMIVFSGFRYITAGGESAKISTAQQGIIYALVGLVVAALAQIIIRYLAATVPVV